MNVPSMRSLSADLTSLEAALASVKEAVAQIKREQINDPVAAPVATGSYQQHPFQDDHALARKAAELYAQRRARDRVFAGFKLFGEPAWDILLDLFLQKAQHRGVSVSSATSAAAAAATTAIRCIAALERCGLIERTPDLRDRRRSFIQLTERGYDLVSLAIVG